MGGNYVDVHTHVLPCIDDGATSMDESMVMIKIQEQNNVKTIIATPHYYPYEQSIESFIERRNEAFKKIKGFSNVKIVLGSEVFLNSNLLEYNNIDMLCIEKTNYLLLELDCFSEFNHDIFDMIQMIKNDYQIIPIIAHVERYKPLKTKHIKQLKDIGCLIQVNSSSFFDIHSIKVNKLAKKGLIDLIGSDCHNTTSRVSNMERAMIHIEKKYKVIYDKIIENQEKLIRG